MIPSPALHALRRLCRVRTNVSLHGIVLAALQFALLTAVHAADAPVQLTPAHRAVVDHQRRIFFQYDVAADIQLKGGFG